MTKSKIDILFLSHRYEITSGGEKALLDMLKYLVSMNIKPHVIIGDSGGIVKHLTSLGIPYSVVYLPFWVHDGNDPTPFRFTSLNPTVNTTLTIVNLIKAIKPRLCVTNTIAVPWLGYAAAITATPHAWMIHELGTAGFNFRYAIGEAQTIRSIDNLSDKIFYNSKYTSEYYLPQFNLNNGDNPAIIYPAGEIPEPEKIDSPYTTTGLKLVCVGQIKKQKGQLDAVMALSELTKHNIKAELILIGGTEEKDYLSKIIHFVEEKGLQDYVQLLGHQVNPASFVSHADIAISCATNESFGRVIVEAMLLRKLVIGARSAGTAEILDSKDHGILYEPGNPKHLANILEDIHARPNQIKKTGEKAYAIAKELYSTEHRYSSFIKYYRKIPAKSALDLTILDSVIEDFSGTNELLSAKRRELAVSENKFNGIKNSLVWRALKKARSLLNS